MSVIVAIFTALFIAMTGIFSREMEEEVRRTKNVPLPTAEEIIDLLTGHAAPPVPGWPEVATPSQPKPEASDHHE